MRILALDPGESTGMALFHGIELEFSETIAMAAEGFILAYGGGLPPHDVLVMESFIVDPTFVGRAHASEVIGAAMAISDAPVKTFQSRSDKATLVKGTEARRFKWLRARGFVGTSHELDADTHALLYLRKTGDKDVVKRYWL